MVKIVTDTGTSLSPAMAEKMGVTLLPFTIIVDGKEYYDYFDLQPIDFLNMQRAGKLGTTSQPNAGLMEDAFRSASAENPVLYIAVGDGLSGAYPSALAVRSGMDNAEHIYVFDSTIVSSPQYVMVRKAKMMADAGATVQEIIASLKKNTENHKSFLAPQDIGFLQRGGRLRPSAAKIVNFLGLLPVLTQSEDKRAIDKSILVRGFSKAVDKAISAFKEMGVDEHYHICITHGDNLKDARFAYDRFCAAFPNTEIEIFHYPCVICNQAGPMAISMQCCYKD